MIEPTEEIIQAQKSVKKAQEKVAIQALVKARKDHIAALSVEFETWLTQHSQSMKNYASQTFTADIEQGFKGKAATTAKEKLQGIRQPAFQNPMYSGK